VTVGVASAKELADAITSQKHWNTSVAILDAEDAEIEKFRAPLPEGTPLFEGIKKIFEIRYEVNANGENVLLCKHSSSPMEQETVRTLDFQVSRAQREEKAKKLERPKGADVQPRPPAPIEEEPPAVPPLPPPVVKYSMRQTKRPSYLMNYDCSTL
jgi:hypothetical protein